MSALIRGALLLAAIAGAQTQGEDPIARALSQHQFEDALTAINNRLKTSPTDTRLWMLRGAALHALQNSKESLASYRKAIQYQPNLMPALQAVAQIEYSLKDPNARKTLARIVTLDPRNEVAHAMSGVLAYEDHDCEGAVQHFEKAGRQVEQQKASLQQYGYCLLQVNRPAEAAPLLERLVAMDGADPQARMNLVVALSAAGRTKEAIELLKPLAQGAVPEPDVLGLLAELYRANQQTEEAIAEFRRGIALYPQQERLYIGLAALCSYYNSGELGVEVVEIGLKNIPDSSRLYAMRGVLYSQMGQREKSIADFERSSELSPVEHIGKTGLALSMMQEGRIEELIQQTRAQLRKNPKDAASQLMLAQALLRNGARAGDKQFGEAQSALERAVQLDPKSEQALALLGKVYLDSGKTAQAIKELEWALSLRGENRVAMYQLMLAYASSGRDEDSARMQERLKKAMEKERQQDLERSRIRLMKIAEER